MGKARERLLQDECKEKCRENVRTHMRTQMWRHTTTCKDTFKERQRHMQGATKAHAKHTQRYSERGLVFMGRERNT